MPSRSSRSRRSSTARARRRRPAQNASSAANPASMARSFSARERPSTGAQASNICSANSRRSARLTSGSRYATPAAAKASDSFVNAARTVRGVAATVGQAFWPARADERRVEHVEHREEDAVQRRATMLDGEQVVHVRDRHLRRVARVDAPAAGAAAIQLGARAIGIDDPIGRDAEALQIRAEERRVRVHVQHARDADTRAMRVARAAGSRPGAAPRARFVDRRRAPGAAASTLRVRRCRRSSGCPRRRGRALP